MTASAGVRQTLAIGSALLLAVMVYVAQGVMHMAPASLFLLIFLFARLVPRVTLIYEKDRRWPANSQPLRRLSMPSRNVSRQLNTNHCRMKPSTSLARSNAGRSLSAIRMMVVRRRSTT